MLEVLPEPALTSPVPSFLGNPKLRLLFFGGKGGVGKTTCAAATALHLARGRPSCEFLVVSTDPAHSLADCLAGDRLPGNLEVREIDPQESWLRFSAAHGETLRKIALRGTFADEADIAGFLDLPIPGLDEVAALLEMMQWVKENRYACIVVDTAPAGHTLKFLGMPRLMRRLLDLLDAMLAKHRFLAGLYGGGEPRDDADRFVEKTAADLQSLQALLRSAEESRFVPVLHAEELSAVITGRMLAELKKLRIPVRELVVNRLRGRSEGAASCPHCARSALRQHMALDRIASRFRGYALWALPQCAEEFRGVERLETLWGQGRALPEPAGARPAAPRYVFPLLPTVERPAPLPAPALKLLLFAGKGGVGKTTLACATALRLAQDGRNLLASVDPAHSLGSSLGLDIGAREVPVVPGLWAIEFDVEAEYRRFKRAYGKELKEAVARLARGQKGMGLAFEREVLEGFFDLTPPGLEEIVALTRVAELVEKGRYDRLILDCSPTGHFLRYLEAPALLEQWLRTVFAFLLKYRSVFWLEGIAGQMVELSRRIKRLRRMLVDRAQTAVMVVATATRVVGAETLHLLAACRRLGLEATTLFVNMLAPLTACLACSASRLSEEEVRRDYARAFPQAHLACVSRAEEPRGIARLLALGSRLYAEPAGPAGALSN